MDPIDLKLVEILRQDPRSTNRKIATQIGVSEVSVGTRIRRLLENGDAKVVGYQDLAHLGYDMTVHVDVSVQPGKSEEVGQALAQSPRLDVIVIVSGSPQIMAVFWARDNADALDVIMSEIETVEGVASIETNLSSLVVKTAAGATQKGSQISLDSIDRQILDLLWIDGRIGSRGIARRLGIAEATARSRMRRMQESAGLRYRLMIHQRFARHLASAYVGIRAWPGRCLAVAEAAAHVRGCLYSAVTLGRYNVFCYFLTTPREDLHQIMRSQLESIDGIRSVSIREILHVLKHQGQIGSSLDH